MRILLVILLFTAVLPTGRAQEVHFEATDSIVGDFSMFSVDNFGRITVVHNDVLVSFSGQLDTMFSTSFKQLRPTTIESSKSFRTLVFDQERSVIHFFDNTLTDIHGQIDLVNLDIQQPWLVAESFAGNTIWVLDAGSMRLIKLNENLEKILITENLVTVFSNEKLPVQMMEHNDLLFVLIPGTGVAIFDVFGTFIRMHECDAESIDVFKNFMLLKKGNTITATSYIPDEVPDQVFEIPAGTRQFKFTAEQVYFLTDKALLVGTYKTSGK
jgi:hypothetical protein